MNEPDIRSRLRDLAGEAPEPFALRSQVLRRARRRVVLTVGATVAALVVLVLGSVMAVRSISASPPPLRPAQKPNVFAPAHGWIAYGNNSGIWAVNPGGSGLPKDLVRLSDTPGQPIAWSSDGSALLIVGLEQRELNAGAPQGLWVLHSDGKETWLFSTKNEFAASISPDGSRVVYSIWNGRPPHSSIFIVDSHGGRPRLLKRGPGNLLSPMFSPDGTQIAYVDGGASSSNGVRVMNADGSGVRVLLPTYEKDGLFDWPSAVGWSADGSHVAFEGQGGIFIIAANGSGLTKLIPGGGKSQWSPTGSQLAFVRSGQIFVMNADGSGLHQLTHLPRTRKVDLGWPSWSLNGSRIAFVDDRCQCGIGTLYTMSADGTDVHAMEGVRPDGSIAWNPG